MYIQKCHILQHSHLLSLGLAVGGWWLDVHSWSGRGGGPMAMYRDVEREWFREELLRSLSIMILRYVAASAWLATRSHTVHYILSNKVLSLSC